MFSKDAVGSGGVGPVDSSTHTLVGFDTPALAEWVLFHVPHDSTFIPPLERSSFLLNDADLNVELLRMTDHWTFDLFAQGIPGERVLRFPASRLLVDVERFQDDTLEVMALRGMGAVYQRTADGKQLRHAHQERHREELMNTWYHPHHQALTEATQRALDQHGRALLIDAHSFPASPLSYELDQRLDRPDICIGTDSFHTSPLLQEAFVHAFETTGWSVRVNTPFAGALVPMSYYGRDHRVAAIMVEVNRALYIDETSGERLPCFSEVARTVRQSVLASVSVLDTGGL